MNPPITLVHRAIQLWTTCYTAGLPGPAGSQRRAEIDSDLAERTWLGGLDNYAEEVNTAGGAIAAIIVLLLGAVIVTGCVLRPIAPLVANIATVAIAIWSVLWFWLGAAPIGALAVVGAIADMFLRAPALRSST